MPLTQAWDLIFLTLPVWTYHIMRHEHRDTRISPAGLPPIITLLLLNLGLFFWSSRCLWRMLWYWSVFKSTRPKSVPTKPLYGLLGPIPVYDIAAVSRSLWSGAKLHITTDISQCLARMPDQLSADNASCVLARPIWTSTNNFSLLAHFFTVPNTTRPDKTTQN
jgi:hypothetical protein